MDRGSVKHKISTDRICRGAIENLLMAKIPRWIEQLSTRQKLSQWIENLLRSYQDKFQVAQWIKDAIRSVKKKSPRVSIDSYLSRICQEAVELDKKQFLKRKKNTHK